MYIKKILSSGIIAFVLVLGTFSNPAHAATSLTGWAWSSNIGWISFNSANPGAGSGAAYSVKLSTTTPTSGTFDGNSYAWSPHIGWISFNTSDLSASPACPGATAPQVDLSTGDVSGWIRAIVGIGGAGGWDGCIKLSEPTSGTLFPTRYADGSRGVTYNKVAGQFRGYSWGGDVVGWLQFSPNLGIGNPVTCNGASCEPGGSTHDLSLSASGGGSSGGNITVAYGSTVTIDWTISNLTNCSTSGADWSRVGNYTAVAAEQSNTGQVVFNSGDIGAHVFGIDCDTFDVPASKESRFITVNVTATPALTCVQPAHATACPDPNVVIGTIPDGTPQTTVLTGQSLCSATATTYCQYYCASGYRKNGNSCRSSSIEEI